MTNATGLILEGCIVRYVLACGEAVRLAILAGADRAVEPEAGHACFRSRLALEHLTGAIRAHEDATGWPHRAALMSAVGRQVELAESLARDAARQQVRAIEVFEPRSAA